MVKIVDAIMGSGKSTAAINYMNEHPDKKFIYITPYLDEVHRVKDACSQIKLYSPAKMSEFSGSKVFHTIDLVRKGKSVATTHQAFRCYPPELLELIKEQEYTIIIDENVDTLVETTIAEEDIRVLEKSGYIEEIEDGEYKLVDHSYRGGRFSDMMEIMKSRDIVRIRGKRNGVYTYYWQLPPELITSAKDVYVLTYLFKGQSIRYFLDVNDIPYELWNISKGNDGKFRFSNTDPYIPEYVKTLKEKIHIVDHGKMNDVGEKINALSVSWMNNPKSDVDQVKKNMYNLFRHVQKVPVENRMWSTFESKRHTLRGRGYSKSFTPFNQRATNRYKDATVLAYCVNIYMHTGQKIFFQQKGVDINDDDYALSTMIQWIWRSAIRDGKEIWVYIPSKRMRTLLQNWIEEVSCL